MPPDDTTPERVDLDPAAADAIATKTAEKVDASDVAAMRREFAELRALLSTPQRSEFKADAGVIAKGDALPVYGGDDIYTFTGESDAQVATNLWLAQSILRGVGQGRRELSERGQHVMLTAGERALKSAPAAYAPNGAARDRDEYVRKTAGMYRSEARIKALTSTGVGTGDEWVPTFATSELWRDIHLATQVAAQFRRIDMPTNPYDLPTETADINWKYASTENVAVTASQPTTAKATLTAVKLMAEVDFSGEVTEDSIIPIVPTLRADLVRTGAQQIDDQIVHSDTTTAATGNVNSDDAAPTAGSPYLAQSGLRKFCITTNTGQVSNFAAAVTSALFNTLRGLLGKYGAQPQDLITVTGTSTYLSMLTIAEIVTAEKYGPAATVLRGELARFFNIPIFLSEAIPGATTDKVDADGKYTTTTPASNDTKGWLALVNTRMWTTGFRRDFQIESFRDIQKDQNILVASFRMALIPGGHSVTHTALARNITV